MILQKAANYEIVECLGTGPLGTVSRARDHERGCDVALRVMSSAVVRWDADLRSRFQHEAEAICTLKHPNIAQWYEVGEYGDGMYVAAELVPGADLKRFIAERGALAIENRIAVMHQVAGALAYAHRAGILHRDIRPANIFLQPDGIVKIADFGLAAMTSGYVAKAAVRWGSPLYLCPEQIRQKSYDNRSEVFAAGTVFYEFLTGHYPFQNANSNRVLDDIASEEHLPPFEALSDAPAGLCSVVARCLSKEPSDRFANMSDLEGALAELVDDVGKECQAMLVELQIATHRLKRAAAIPGAPPEIGELARNIRELLSSDHRRDYESLDRLMAALAEQSTVIHALTKGPARRPAATLPSPLPARQENAVDADIHPPAQSDAAPGPETGPAVAYCEDAHGAEPSAPMQPAPDLEPMQTLDAGELEYLNVMISEIGGPARASEALEPAPAQAEAPEETQPVADSREAPSPVPAVPNVRPGFRIPVRPLAAVAAVLAVCVALACAWPYRNRAWQFIRSSLRIPAAASHAPQAPEGEAPVATSQGPVAYEPATDVLIREARQLAEQGRAEAGRVFLQRALVLEPGNEKARLLLATLDLNRKDAEIVQDPLQADISTAAGLIAAGQLRRARGQIERIATAQPDHPALSGLRKSLEAKAVEIGREAARKKSEQTETARRNLADENWSKRATELFRGGKYSELSVALEQWSRENPGSTQAGTLRSQAVHLQQLLGSFQSALSEKRYGDAAVALARTESLNPADPSLPELKRLLESRRATARARLTVVRLAEPGVLLLDSAPLGRGGEVRAAPVAIGAHVVSVKIPGGSTLTANRDFSDGEDVSLVYDGSSLRLAAESDLEAALARKALEQTHRFAVEHTHGLLRGACKGELLVNGFDVIYRPGTGSHGFQVPFSRLNVTVEDRSVDLRFASDNTVLQSFRMRDASEAAALRQMWVKLQELPR